MLGSIKVVSIWQASINLEIFACLPKVLKKKKYFDLILTSWKVNAVFTRINL